MFDFDDDNDGEGAPVSASDIDGTWSDGNKYADQEKRNGPL